MDKDQREDIRHAPAQIQEWVKNDSRMNSNRQHTDFYKTAPTVLCTFLAVQTAILCTLNLGNKLATANDNSYSL
jgi:hypothetical protein